MSLTAHCTTGLVIDACVLNHACHPEGVIPETCRALLEQLQQSELTWFLDDTGGTAPAIATSRLATEYQQTVDPGSFPLTLLTRLAAEGRVVFVPRPDEAARAQILALVPDNAGDRALVGAAYNTPDQLVASNDGDDLPDDVRDSIEQTVGVVVRWSYELVGEL